MSYTLFSTVQTVPPFSTLCYREKCSYNSVQHLVLMELYDKGKLLKSVYKKATFEITNINICIHT